jgi:hypothetical protein
MSGLFPVEASSLIEKFEWVTPLWTYPDLAIGGDTYPITWAEDDMLYASSGDPNYGSSHDGFDVVRFSGTPPTMRLEQINPMPEWVGGGGWGAKPTGMISVDGTLYLAIQNVLGWRTPSRGRSSQHGSDALILVSADKGKTWTPGAGDFGKPMFPGARFGGPAFVNHGKNNGEARDGFVYAVSADQWDNGTELRVGRVPSDQVADPKAWKWVEAWEADGSPRWSPWLNDAIPVLSSPRTMSCPDMIWMPALGRYLLVTWYFHKDFDPALGTDLIIYEAPEPWGPFKLAHYEREWLGRVVGPYCPRIVSKWLDADGLGGWMLVSGNFVDALSPGRPHYRPNLIRFRIKLRA